MKRILALILVLSLSFTIVACGKSGNNTDKDEIHNAEEEKASENKEGNSVEVDKKLINVEVTIPASLLQLDNEEELDIDQITEEAKKQGMKKVIANDDGSITYIMSKATHKEVMEEMKSSLTESIDEVINNGDFPSIQDIIPNEMFSEFDVVVNKAKFENSLDGMAALGIAFQSMFYQLFDGVEPDNYEVILNFKDEDTGEVFESVTYPDAFNE